MSSLIKRKVLISMLFIGLTMMGLFSYQYLSMELYPNAELPNIYINISSSLELDQEYIDRQAVSPVEGVVSGLEGVEGTETRISNRGARITIAYKQDVNIKYAFLKLEALIKNVASTLPEEFTVRVNKSGGSSMNHQFMTLQVLGDDDLDYVRNITDAEIVEILESIDGISQVNVMGGQQKSVEIIVDKNRCEALKITPARLSGLIRKNMASNTFLGSVYKGSKQYFLNIKAEYVDVSDLGNIVVAKGPILLKDIAEINFGVKEAESYSRLNGKEIVTCRLIKAPLANVIDLSERVRPEIDRLNQELESKGISIIIDNDSSELMSKNIDMIVDLGISGALLAIFILYLFLKNFRIITIIAFAIPISVFSAFYFFYFYDISINILTLTGISLAIGMLLDNSVVVMENIFRLKATGLSSLEAASRGTKEVTKAIIASTITTITVFLPFLFSKDYLLKLIGEHVGVSIISTLLLSLLVALLLIPMAVYHFMSKMETK